MKEAVIVSAVRTALGNFNGFLANIGATQLGALVMEEAIRRAVEKTVPPLLESGHYLPCLDDRPRSNIPFGNYRFFRRILEEMALKG